MSSFTYPGASPYRLSSQTFSPIIRPIWIGLTGCAYVCWLLSLLPHPIDSRWSRLIVDMPNAMLLNVLGFEANIHQQYQFYGPSMPWLGGWQYTSIALSVGLLIPITAIISARLCLRRQGHHTLTILLSTLPLAMACMANLCCVINMFSMSAWQSYVQNESPLVYQGIIIHGTSPLYPVLSLLGLWCVIALILRFTSLKQYLSPTLMRFELTLAGFIALCWFTWFIGKCITGKQPPILNRDGGYDSAAFLLISTMLWQMIHVSTLLLIQKPINTSKPNPIIRTNILIRWCLVGITLLIGSWLIHLGMAFSDLPGDRWCQVAFHQAASLGGWVRLACMLVLMGISVGWYYWFDTRILRDHGRFNT